MIKVEVLITCVAKGPNEGYALGRKKYKFEWGKTMSGLTETLSLPDRLEKLMEEAILENEGDVIMTRACEVSVTATVCPPVKIFPSAEEGD